MLVIMNLNPLDRRPLDAGIGAGQEKMDLSTLVECAGAINRQAAEERYIPLDHFAGVYPPEKIAYDQRRLAATKEQIRRTEEEFISHIEGRDRKDILGSKDISHAFEASVIDLATDNGWFGDGTLTRLPEFCDIIEHTDAVLTIPTNENPEHVAVGIDTSRNLNDIDIDRKVGRNLKEVFDMKNPTRVTYFESDVANKDGSFYKGKLTDIIPVVIGTDRDQCDSIIFNYGRMLQLEKARQEATTPAEKQRLLSKIRGHRDELARTPAQMVFLRAVKMQLEMYERIVNNFLTAETSEEERGFCVQKKAQIEQLMGLFKNIEKAKLEEGFDNDEVDHNEFVTMLDAVIKTNLKHLGVQ